MKKIAIALALFALVAIIPVASVSAQEETTDFTIDIDFQSGGRCDFDATAHSETELDPGAGMASAPISEAEGSVDVSSPSSGRVEIDAGVSLTFIENQITPEIEMSLASIDREKINNGFPGTSFEGLESFEGENLGSILSSQGMISPVGGLPSVPDENIPLEFSGITIETLTCTSFEWERPDLSADFMIELSDEILENQKMREGLPLEMELSSGFSDSSMNLSFDFDSPEAEFSLEISSNFTDMTQITDMSLEGYVNLPQEGENVDFDMGSLSLSGSLGPAFQSMEDQLEQTDLTLSIEVPSGARVSGMPEGAQKDGNEYTWNDQSAVSAISSMASGQTETDITYQSEASDGGLPYTLIGAGVLVLVIAIAGLVLVRL